MSQSLFQHTKHEEYCPQCGSPLQMKQGVKGLFLGCTAYPACDYLRPLHKVENKVLKELDEACPQCGNPLQLKQGAFGMFIGCSHYPDCDFVVHEQQDDEQSIDCPECHKGHLVARRGRQGENLYGCDNPFPLQIFLARKTLCHALSTMPFSTRSTKSENAEHQSVAMCK